MKIFTIIAFLAIALFSSCNAPTDPKGYTDLEVAAFKDKMVLPETVVLDVRTPEEAAKGMISDAIHKDYETASFEADVAKLEKDKTYLIYCQGGGRSSKACDVMVRLGFKNLYNLKGGYDAWTEK